MRELPKLHHQPQASEFITYNTADPRLSDPASEQAIEYKLILAALIDSEQMLLCIATDEGLRGGNILHSLRVHSCASMLNNICSEVSK